jgi:hypothetical protein
MHDFFNECLSAVVGRRQGGERSDVAARRAERWGDDSSMTVILEHGGRRFQVMAHHDAIRHDGAALELAEPVNGELDPALIAVLFAKAGDPSTAPNGRPRSRALLPRGVRCTDLAGTASGTTGSDSEGTVCMEVAGRGGVLPQCGLAARRRCTAVCPLPMRRAMDDRGARPGPDGG